MTNPPTLTCLWAFYRIRITFSLAPIFLSDSNSRLGRHPLEGAEMYPVRRTFSLEKKIDPEGEITEIFIGFPFHSFMAYPIKFYLVN